MDKEALDRRREMVRHWFFLGTQVSVIVEKLSKHPDALYFSPLLTYKQKLREVTRDIKAIKKAAYKPISMSQEEVNEAHSIYVARAEYLFDLAVQQGDLSLARVLNQDSAKARGVQTEEPITVKADDLLTALKNARERGQKAVEQRKNKVIDVTPEPTVEALPAPQDTAPALGPMAILKKIPANLSAPENGAASGSSLPS